MATVVVGVADVLRHHLQLGEGAEGDARMLDGVQEAVARRRGHRVEQLLRAARRVGRRQDVGAEDDLLTFAQTHRPAPQHQLTCGSHDNRRTSQKMEEGPGEGSHATSDLSGPA